MTTLKPTGLPTSWSGPVPLPSSRSLIGSALIAAVVTGVWFGHPVLGIAEVDDQVIVERPVVEEKLVAKAGAPSRLNRHA